jgi:hypothetical protein
VVHDSFVSRDDPTREGEAEMRIRVLISVLSVALAVPVMPVHADGILDCLHRHDCPSDCPQQTVVRLPSQEIQIQTMRPQVIVNEVAPVRHHRAAVAAVPVPMMFAQPVFAQPMVAQPMVATFLTPGVQGVAAPASGNSAFRAYQDLVSQQFEVVSERARMKAQMDFLDATHKQIVQNLNASANVGSSGMSSSDVATLQKSIDDLSTRCGNIEKLLQIHDRILQEQVKK